MIDRLPGDMFTWGALQTVSQILIWELVAVFIFIAPGRGFAEVPKPRLVRAVKIIDQDEAGLPIRFPASLAYDPLEDEIYISSPLKNKLVLLTADFFPYMSIGAGRGLNSVSGSYLHQGLLYVCVGASASDPNPHVAIYDSAFLLQKKIYFPNNDGFSPLDLVVGITGNLYLTGLNGGGVLVLDSAGNYLRTIEPRDEVLGVREKTAILTLAVSSIGNLFFVSESMGRIYVYDRDERFLYKFGEKGGEKGKLSRPRGIALDEFRQQVYIVDYQRHTVAVFHMRGDFLFEFGGMGRGRGWFYYPNDILVDGRGRMLIADSFNHRVQVLEFVNLPVPERVPQEEILVTADPEINNSIAPLPERGKLQIARLQADLPSEKAGDFLVLVLISRDGHEAEALAGKLSEKGYSVHVIDLDKAIRGNWHQVLIGPYVDPLESYRVAETLQRSEQLPAILKTRGEPIVLEIPFTAETSNILEPIGR